MTALQLIQHKLSQQFHDRNSQRNKPARAPSRHRAKQMPAIRLGNEGPPWTH